MRLTDRLPYQAIVDRPRLILPNNARLAVWVILNVEEWGIERPMPRTVLPPPMGVPLLPDVPTMAELGFAGYEFNTWVGVAVPKGTPKEIMSNEDVRAVYLGSAH